MAFNETLRYIFCSVFIDHSEYTPVLELVFAERQFSHVRPAYESGDINERWMKANILAEIVERIKNHTAILSQSELFRTLKRAAYTIVEAL